MNIFFIITNILSILFTLLELLYSQTFSSIKTRDEIVNDSTMITQLLNTTRTNIHTSMRDASGERGFPSSHTTKSETNSTTPDEGRIENLEGYFIHMFEVLEVIIETVEVQTFI